MLSLGVAELRHPLFDAFIIDKKKQTRDNNNNIQEKYRKNVEAKETMLAKTIH